MHVEVGLRRFLVLLFGSLLLTANAFGQDSQEYIVKLKSGLRAMNRVNLFQSSDAMRMQETHQGGRLIKFKVENNEKGLLELEALKKRTDIEYVVENIQMHMFEEVVDDPKYKQQWALEAINAAKAWDKTVGSKKIIVAVIDTGVDTKHEDLKNNIWINEDEIAGNGKDDDNNGYVDDIHGWDFNGKDNDPFDENGYMNPGHGTHCSGIIGAVGDNGKGISGINQQVSIMPLRFLGSNGGGDLFASVKAIDYATENGAHVISASWGAAISRSSAQPIIDSIARARDKGVIFVVAAGNEGRSNDSTEVYPANANLENVISVAASQTGDTKPQWSNYGKRLVDLAAPGHEILSTLPGNKYSKLSGTSMATPYVAGLAALMLSREESEGLSALQIRSIMQATGKRVAIESKCNCLIDAEAAVQSVIDKNLTVVPAAATLAVNDEVNFGAVGGAGGYELSVSDDSIASLDADGKLKALKEGQVIVAVKDSAGAVAESLPILVLGQSEVAPEPAQCPLGNEFLCTISCLFVPDLPWCSQGGGGGGEDGKSPFPFPIPGFPGS